jgi:hypothetical protein
MKADGHAEPIRVNFLTSKVVDSGEEVRRILTKAMYDAGYEPDLSSTEILGPLAHLPAAPVLVASNLDALAHHVARQFLFELRTLVLEMKVSALISGEFELLV